MELRALEKLVVEALADIKGRDTEVISTTALTALFDSMIIACGDSHRQVRALARNVQEKVRAAGVDVLSCEGEEVGEWILIDLGDVVVHVMQPAVRSYYNLEELWGGVGPARMRRTAAGEPAATAGRA